MRCLRLLTASLLGSVLMLPTPLAAQLRSWSFRNRAYYDPISAEPRAAQTQVLFPARSSSFPFAANPGQSWVWDINLGHEIPIVGWEQSTSTRSGDPVPPGKFGFGIWFPLSFHMVEDMGKDPSNPILNTDYRFGGMIKAQWGLPDKLGPIELGHIGLRFVPFAHESTHVGDEFTVAAIRLYGAKFQRINVSYEYWELGGSFEPNFGKDHPVGMKFRGGVVRPFNQQKGWYDTTVLQPFGDTVTSSKRNFEPYAGMEIYRSPMDSAGNVIGYGPFLSFDFRNRTVYTYDRPHRSDPERVQGSVNLMVGVRHIRGLGLISPSYYLRYYHGVNPAGQFRSQPNYQLYGLGFMFDF